MEWEGIITGLNGTPLGTLESVAKELTGMFPDISFGWTRKGTEDLMILDARGVELPSLLRRVLAAKPSFLCGSCKIGRASISFNLGSGDPVTTVWVTVGGNRGQVKSVLTSLRQPADWILESPEQLELQNVMPDEVIELTGGTKLFFADPSHVSGDHA